jgi:tetratricopeptide (TPR) repeat protein
MAPMGYGAPAQPAHPGGIDPYSETGIMPAYGNWPGQGMPQPGMPMGMPPVPGQMGYAPGTGYGVELGAPVRKRSPVRLIAVAVVVLLGAAIGIKVVADRGETEQVAATSVKKGDPCEGVGETCADPTDQTCLNCLNKRTRLSRGRELFSQGDFSGAVQEFQRVLQEVDPLDNTALRLRYVSYEFWVLNAMGDTLRDRSQTAAQKVQKMQDDLAKAKELYDRFGKASYTKDTPEPTLANARNQLSEAVSLLNGIAKMKSDDPSARSIQAEADQLRGRALGQINRLKVIKMASAQEAFTESVAAVFNEAMQLKSSGNLARASAKFKEVMDKDPEHKTPYADQARQELDSIGKALKDRAKPLVSDATYKMHTEQWVEARVKLQEALKIDPNLEEARAKLAEVNEECQKRAKKLYSEAKVQYNVSQYSQAEKLLRQVLTFVPDKNDDTHQKAERMLQDMGKN